MNKLAAENQSTALYTYIIQQVIIFYSYPSSIQCYTVWLDMFTVQLLHLCAQYTYSQLKLHFILMKPTQQYHLTTVPQSSDTCILFLNNTEMVRFAADHQLHVCHFSQLATMNSIASCIHTASYTQSSQLYGNLSIATLAEHCNI